MKLLPLVLFLAPTALLKADQWVVFGEKDYYAVGSTAAAAVPANPEHLAFFNAVAADQSRHPSFERSADLIVPPAWGKTVGADTRGTILYHPSFVGGFASHISLRGLRPHHDYILTLNGNPAKSGNGLLLSAVPGNEKERYYDFLVVTTDAFGVYDASLGIYLKRGRYDVRFYVKDTADFKIVLYRDFFVFEAL